MAKATDDLLRDTLHRAFEAVRALSATLTEGLSAEDQQLQSMPDASPIKWHLAHTSWFFEALVLRPHAVGYQPFDERYFYLFNSYYEALGPRHPRPQRGLLSRPSIDEVWRYRRHVDAAVQVFLRDAGAEAWVAAAPMLRLGLHHEQQHQELMLTDLKHAFSMNPLLPAWRPAGSNRASVASALRWQGHDGGV
ncbi:DinB family protein, partial [Aquabacterium sp.]|uniref:DinB family protein n=1 Tax=Aquabacterium sp. TaxID=1872578 RepID=UPI002B666ED8